MLNTDYPHKTRTPPQCSGNLNAPAVLTEITMGKMTGDTQNKFRAKLEKLLEGTDIAFNGNLICRKLNLQPGQKILDIGCGWGSFMKYYLLSCAGAFRARANQLWQIVLSKNGVQGGYISVR